MLKVIEVSICAASNMIIEQADSMVNYNLPATADEMSTTTTTATVMSQHPLKEDEGAERGTDAAAQSVAASAQAVGPVLTPLGSETRKVLQNARKLSTKLRARAYSHAMARLDHVKMRSTATIEKLKPYSLDLLVYAREHLDALADMEDEPTTVDNSPTPTPTTHNNQTAFASVAGSTTAGAIVAHVQRNGRRMVSKSARKVRSLVNTGEFALVWFVDSVKHSPTVVHNASNTIFLEINTRAHAVNQVIQNKTHAITHNAVVLQHTLQHQAHVVHEQLRPYQQQLASMTRIAIDNTRDLLSLAPQSLMIMYYLAAGYGEWCVCEF